MLVEVYSDGSSHAKGGLPGGWATVIVVDGQPVAMRYGGDPNTSNNRMEMEGVIQGLRYVLEKGLDKGTVVMVSDSKYALRIATGEYSPSKNLDKALELRKLAKSLNATARWVKGHAGDHYNERCDRFAKLGKQEASGV